MYEYQSRDQLRERYVSGRPFVEEARREIDDDTAKEHRREQSLPSLDDETDERRGPAERHCDDEAADHEE